MKDMSREGKNSGDSFAGRGSSARLLRRLPPAPHIP
jgi:hypothetical protein